MDYIKGCIIALAAAISSYFGNLAAPIALLVLCNVIDYSTGIIAAPGRDEKISSYKGIRGIAKKICMWLLVIVGVIFDETLKIALQAVGIDIHIKFLISLIVCLWLVFNEIISILENMMDIGAPIPGFLQPFVKNMQKSIEKKVSESIGPFAVDEGAEEDGTETKAETETENKKPPDEE